MLDILKEEFLEKLAHFSMVDQLVKILIDAVDLNENFEKEDCLSDSIYETRLTMLRQSIMCSDLNSVQ